MCFNAAKSWQLGWYTGKTYTIQSPSSNPPADTGTSYVGKLQGIVDYMSNSNAKVLIKINTVRGDDYFINFNARKGFNIGTQEGGNQIMIVTAGAEGLAYSESTLVAKLNAGGSYQIGNFDGSGMTLSVDVLAIDSSNDADVTICLGDCPATTVSPIAAPIRSPTRAPTRSPTRAPTRSPTRAPAMPPTRAPAKAHTSSPTELSLFTSNAPSLLPSCVQVEPNIPVVDLGTAGNYAILSKTGISNVPNSRITGNIAVSPVGGASVTGFLATPALSGSAATSSQAIGGGYLYAANYGGNTAAILTQAVLDMHAAYTDAATRVTTDLGRINLNGGILAGDILTPGVYTFTTPIDIQDDITFCGGANDVFIIQTPLTLSMSVSGKKVLLDCGARAENIFWQAATAVSIATGAHMEGNILGKTTVTMMTGSSINGIIHSQTFVILQIATITPPVPELGPCLSDLTASPSEKNPS